MSPSLRRRGAEERDGFDRERWGILAMWMDPWLLDTTFFFERIADARREAAARRDAPRD